MAKHDRDAFAAVDRRIIELSKDIKILSQLSWPRKTQDLFLEGWRKGNPQIPEISHQIPLPANLEKDLDKLVRSIDGSHPVGSFLKRTAESYFFAALMLRSAGTPRFTEYSKTLYGEPSDCLEGSDSTHLEAAHHFIEIADQFGSKPPSPESEGPLLTSEELKTYLDERIGKVITEDKVNVALDPDLTAKATAGAERVRIRSRQTYTLNEAEQLLQHEVFTHTLTALNGRKQVVLKSMGLGAPRTTAAQEGLATFSELMTRSIDLLRLKRIALRITAIDLALKGADFIEVFKHFLNEGQDESESYLSTMRVFRGGNPAGGGIVFTKDNAYLTGLLSVHSFFRAMLRDNRFEVARTFFAGRMTVADAVELHPFIDHGLLTQARYLPEWLRDVHSLAATLAFSLFANKIRVERLGTV